MNGWHQISQLFGFGCEFSEYTSNSHPIPNCHHIHLLILLLLLLLQLSSASSSPPTSPPPPLPPPSSSPPSSSSFLLLPTSPRRLLLPPSSSSFSSSSSSSSFLLLSSTPIPPHLPLPLLLLLLTRDQRTRLKMHWSVCDGVPQARKQREGGGGRGAEGGRKAGVSLLNQE